jgi:hypothetical protein
MRCFVFNYETEEKERHHNKNTLMAVQLDVGAFHPLRDCLLPGRIVLLQAGWQETRRCNVNFDQD